MARRKIPLEVGQYIFTGRMLHVVQIRDNVALSRSYTIDRELGAAV